MDMLAGPTALDHGTLARGYRRDIDGLRAIAVLGVVLFHAGVPGFGGGFAGVDIFFVISGYLIGGIVHREVRESRFRFTDFYARRARRIVPALVAVSLATLLLGLLLLGPAELARFATSAAAALLGVSNIWFLHTADYFAPDARVEPFLMTWSLGIEEQFYLLLPPALLMLERWKRGAALPVIAATTLASLLLSAVATSRWPTESFYLLPTRAWELGIGVTLAIGETDRGWRPNPLIREVLGWVGLAAVIAAVMLFSDTVRFPGVAALVPTLGAAALIAGQGSRINRHLLSSAPLVGIGLVSYSWYLWHWPLLALARAVAAVSLSPTIGAAIAFGSLIPALLSWRFVERPFRRRVRPNILPRYGLLLASAVAVIAGVALLHGLPQRLDPAVLPMERTLAESRGGPCLAGYGIDHPVTGAGCISGPTPRIALLGDSHAGALGPALRDRAAAAGLGFVQFTAVSCPPLIGATRALPDHPGAGAACARFNQRAMAAVLHDPAITTVVLTGFWQGPLGANALRHGETYHGTDGATGGAALARALDRTLATLARAGKRVILLGDVPWLDFDPGLEAYTPFLPARRRLATLLAPGLDTRDGHVTLAYVEPLEDEGATIVADSARRAGIAYLPLRALLCDALGCRVKDGTTPLFIDPQHLSRAGADLVAARLPLFPPSRRTPLSVR